jgi:hypothetical protein
MEATPPVAAAMALFSRLPALLLLVGDASAFLYQPGSPSGTSLGEIWDPSVTWWRGKWCVWRCGCCIARLAAASPAPPD